MNNRFLLEQEIYDIFSSWENFSEILTEQYHLTGGLASYNIHSILNPVGFLFSGKISFFLISEKNTQEIPFIINDIICNSNSYTSLLTIFIFEDDAINEEICRFFLINLRKKWCLFRKDEIIDKERFLSTLNDVFRENLTELIHLQNYPNLNANFRKLIARTNKLYVHELYDEILTNFRKITENAISIWWKRTKGNDSELRNPDGMMIKIKKRLEKLKGLGIINNQLFEKLLSIKYMEDLSAHSMNFQANKNEIIEGIVIIKNLLSTLELNE